MEEVYIPNPNIENIENIEEDRIFAPPTLKKLKFKYIDNSNFYEHELNISDSRINHLDKIIKEYPKMSAKKNRYNKSIEIVIYN